MGSDDEVAWQKFIALYYPLTNELILMKQALERAIISWESLIETYRGFDRWLYEFGKRGIK